MKKQVLASYSGKPGIVRLPSIESANHPTPLCGRIASRSYSLSNPISDSNKGLLTQKNRPISQTSRQCSIDQQMMSTIRIDIEKMIDLSQSFTRYNHSILVKQIQLQENLNKLQELFLPFFRDALTFFTSPNSFSEDDKTFITSASVRSSSFSFLQQWKAVLLIIDTLYENGISSLNDYINEQFNIISKGIETVSTKPEKHTIIYDNINKNCTILNNSLTNLHKLIKELFENFTDPTSESVSYYFSEVKQFLSLYNESFYNVFPKAGFLPHELSSLKSETLTASNDIMSSLRALFAFWPDLKEMILYKDEIQKMLNSAVCQMKLPPSLSRIIAPTPKKKDIPEKETAKKLKPEFTKVELFITNILKGIEKPSLDPKVDLWKRLKMTENLIIDKVQELSETIVKIRGQTHNLQTLLVEADSRKKELEKLRFHNEQLFQSNQELQKQLDEVTKQSEKRREKIEALQNNAERLKEKETIEKVSTKLNKMMGNIDESVQKLEYDEKTDKTEKTDNDENNLTSLEKLNIFVLEKKCSRCREYEQQKKEIMKLISPLITATKGESLVSAIQSLIGRHEKLEIEKARVSTLLKEKEQQLQKVEEATKFLLEKGGAQNDPSRRLAKRPPAPNGAPNSLLESFRNIEDQFQSDMKAMRSAMNERKAREMSEIMGMIDDVIFEDSDGEITAGQPSKPHIKHHNSFANDSEEENERQGQSQGENENKEESVNDSDDDENQFKNVIMAKVKKAADKIDSLQKTIDHNNELFEKVKEWLKSHAEDIDVDGLDFAQSLSLLMRAIDERGNPLQSHVDRLEKESQNLTNRLRRFVERLSRMKDVDPIDGAEMSAIELLTVAERETIKIGRKLESIEVNASSNSYELEAARDSMQTIAERLHRLLQIDDGCRFDDMDLNGLLHEIANYVEEFITGGTNQLFVSVSDLNEMSKSARKTSKFSNSADPRVYLPDILDKYMMNNETIRVIRLFEDTLEEIFKNFDFQNSSFDPDQKDFKYLREKIFQLHLILGKDTNVIADKKVNNVMKKMIGLSSMLFSYIAYSFLGGKESEISFDQSLKQNNNT